MCVISEQTREARALRKRKPRGRAFLLRREDLGHVGEKFAGALAGLDLSQPSCRLPSVKASYFLADGKTLAPKCY